MTDYHAKIGEIVLGRPGKINLKGDLIGARGLGSCVAAVIFDPITKIATLSHVALPSKIIIPKIFENKEPYKLAGRYADTFIDESLVKIKAAGGKITNLKAKITGGAKMFSNILADRTDAINLGERNVIAVKEELKKHKIKLVGENVLGTSSRTVWYNVDTQVMMVKIVMESKMIRV